MAKVTQESIERVREAADIVEVVQGEEAGAAMSALRDFMFEHVYMGAAARREHAKIERVVRTLFEHFADDPARLPDSGGAPGADLGRRVTDYVAGMTDRYCIATFRRIALPEESRL